MLQPKAAWELRDPTCTSGQGHGAALPAARPQPRALPRRCNHTPCLAAPPRSFDWFLWAFQVVWLMIVGLVWYKRTLRKYAVSRAALRGYRTTAGLGWQPRAAMAHGASAGAPNRPAAWRRGRDRERCAVPQPPSPSHHPSPPAATAAPLRAPPPPRAVGAVGHRRHRHHLALLQDQLHHFYGAIHTG